MIKRLMDPDIKSRLTIDAVVKHPWFEMDPRLKREYSHRFLATVKFIFSSNTQRIAVLNNDDLIMTDISPAPRNIHVEESTPPLSPHQEPQPQQQPSPTPPHAAVTPLADSSPANGTAKPVQPPTVVENHMTIDEPSRPHLTAGTNPTNSHAELTEPRKSMFVPVPLNKTIVALATQVVDIPTAEMPTAVNAPRLSTTNDATMAIDAAAASALVDDNRTANGQQRGRSTVADEVHRLEENAADSAQRVCVVE